MRFPLLLIVLLALSGWIALAATAMPPESPVRVLVSVAFLFLCPGTAAVLLADALMTRRGIRPYGTLASVVLAVAVSLALATLVSEAFALTGTFTMVRCLITLAALTTGLVLIPRLTHLGEVKS
ncbi:hypothetical protein ABH926_004883 [Catenulispora sp. GP43]|uniref:hypothetical protein n=1 Tax=Catenulispora sp. GP43 TaxID=3156263 RepID=UPI0035135F55